MKKWFIIGCGGVLVIWLVVIATLLPSLESRLQAAAMVTLHSHEKKEVFKDVLITFSGQEAKLSGRVATEEDKKLAEELITSHVRSAQKWGRRLNPVLAVHNAISVDATSLKSPTTVQHWVLITRYGDRLLLAGHVPNKEIYSAFTGKLLGLSQASKWSFEKHLNESGTIDPALNWLGSLDTLPDFKLADGHKAVTAIGILDGRWHLISPSAKNEEFTAIIGNNPPKPAQLEGALKPLRVWLAAEAEKEKLATTTPPSSTPVIHPSTPATADLLPDLNTSSYIGWYTDGKQAHLFGEVPNQLYKQSVIQNAIGSFSGLSINSSKLVINDKTTLDLNAELKFQHFSQPTRPGIGFMVPGVRSRIYPTDVLDSEIAHDFPEVAFEDGEISRQLADFRLTLLKNGELPQESPYLSLIWTAESMTLFGEVDSAVTQDAIVTALQNSVKDHKLINRLSVTPLVKPVESLTKTLQSIPEIKTGTSGIATVRPGQPWRPGVVHAVYFNTGSDRSKDQERALYQIRRILAATPTTHFEITGHTDNTGNEESNLKLSQERAEKLVQYFVNNGVDPALFTSKGAGSHSPIADNETTEGKALNRRVDVTAQ